MEVLCIGGPLDGARRTVRDRRGVIDAEPLPVSSNFLTQTIAAPAAPIIRTRYVIEQLWGQGKRFWLAHPEGTTIDEALALLMAGYKSK